VNERSQRAHERAMSRGFQTFLATRSVVSSAGLDIARLSRPLVGTAVVLPLRAWGGIGKVLVLRRDDGSDFDWTSILSCTKAASNETSADPWAQDVGKVDFDWSVSPLLEFLASIDQELDTSCIDIAAKQSQSAGKGMDAKSWTHTAAKSRTRAWSKGFDLSTAAGS
jgi:hypothetical protein